MPSISIRVSDLADEAAVSALLARSYPVLLAPDYDPTLLARALPGMTTAQPKLLSSGTYYLALDERDELVGCGGWTAERPGTSEVVPGLAHLRHFATDPSHTRRGIGRALVERCLSEAAAAGRPRTECWSTLGAESFYIACGFVTLERITVPMPPELHFPSIRMQRP